MAKKSKSAAGEQAASGGGKFGRTNAILNAGTLMSAGFSSGVAKANTYQPALTKEADMLYEQARRRTDENLFAAASDDRATRYTAAERSSRVDSRGVHPDHGYKPFRGGKGGGREGWFDGTTEYDVSSDSGSVSE